MCNSDEEPVRAVEDIPLKPITQDNSTEIEASFGTKKYPNTLIPMEKDQSKYVNVDFIM